VQFTAVHSQTFFYLYTFRQERKHQFLVFSLFKYSLAAFFTQFIIDKWLILINLSILLKLNNILSSFALLLRNILVYFLHNSIYILDISLFHYPFLSYYLIFERFFKNRQFPFWYLSAFCRQKDFLVVINGIFKEIR